MISGAVSAPMRLVQVVRPPARPVRAQAATPLARGLAAAVTSNPGVSAALSAYAAGTLSKAVTIQDSAANVASHFADLKAMAAAGKIAAFKLTDAGKPAISVSAADALGSVALLAKLSGASVSVQDSASAVQGALDGLQGVAAKLASIQVSAASGRPTVAFSPAQYRSDAAVLAKIRGAATAVQFSGTLSDYRISANIDGSVSTLDSQGRAGESSKFKGINLFAFSDVTTLADTGDASINALLSGGTNQWWIDGSGASAAASAIQPAGWALAGSSSRHTLSYSFMSGSLPAGASGQDANGFVAMNSVQRTAVRQAFAYLSSLINVTFTESNAADGSADINFGMNTQASSAGYATPPHASGNHNVFVMLAANAPTNSSFDQGSYGWETLIHEIGHALGLKHPGNYNAGGGGASPPYLASALDNRRYSVMSYHQSADASVVTATQTGAGTSYSASGLNPSTYMREDIAALQFLYGAATGSDAQTAAAGFQTSTFGSDWQGFETLWAPGGASVDASASTRSTIVDLRAGAFSSINANPAPTAYLASFPKQVQAFVKTNNTFFGYNDVGLAYGSQITQADGGSGNDAFFDGGYSATIDGGGGTDVVYLSGTRTGWTANGQAISGTAARDGSLTLSGSTTLTNIASGYTISLANIEKLKFYDASKAALTHGAVDLMA